MDVSFGTIWEAIARELPGAVAISEPDRDYTFAEFGDRAARLAAAPSPDPVRAAAELDALMPAQAPPQVGTPEVVPE